MRHLARRTKVPGFRPGKAPRAILERQLGPGAVLDDAVEHLVQDAYREALIQEDILPLTNADVDVVQAEEGKPLIFKATVQVPPEVELGDYKGFNFGPEIDTIDDARVDKVLEELRDQNATLAAVEGRGAQDGDYAVISFVGSRDGEPFEGGTSERMPIILGQERLIPGFESNLLGLEVGGSTEFDITLPGRLPRDRAGREAGPLRGRAARAAREGPAGSRPGLHRDARRLRRPRCAPNRRQDASRSAMRSTAPVTASPTRSSSTRSRTRPWSCPPSWSTRRSR